MDRSVVQLTACRIVDCQGPALDLSAGAGASMTECMLSDNAGKCCAGLGCKIPLPDPQYACAAGGVWMWEDATVAATASTIQGGSCFAVLADGNATCSLEQCKLVGSSQASDRVWEALAGQVAVTEPADCSDFPDHVPFIFESRLV